MIAKQMTIGQIAREEKEVINPFAPQFADLEPTPDQIKYLEMARIMDRWHINEELSELIRTKDLMKLSRKNMSSLIYWVANRDKPDYLKLSINRLSTLPNK